MMKSLIYIATALMLSSCDPSQLSQSNLKNSKWNFRGPDSDGGHSNFGGSFGLPKVSRLSSGSMSIDSGGFLRGPGVNQQRIDSLRGAKFPAGDPRVILLHKTAGRTCQHSKAGNASVPRAYGKPHIYVCRDGSVIVNGSFDYARKKAEAHHNDYTINIELEASYVGSSPEECQKLGIKIPEGAKHCYEDLTDLQAKKASEIMGVVSKHHNIPLVPVIPGKDYYDQDAFISATHIEHDHRCNDGACYMDDDARARGVASSHQTRLAYKDPKNHDDHLSDRDALMLGIPQLVRGNYSYTKLAIN